MLPIIGILCLVLLVIILLNPKPEKFTEEISFEPYLSRVNFTIDEGSILPDEAKFIQNFITKNNCKDIMEIGFNGGLSSYTMLSSGSEVNIVSFDIGLHPYVLNAKKIIDEMFPKRHTLIIGDSMNTVPMYDSKKFDMIFVDGGHEEVTVDTDIKNCLKLLKPGGYIIADDYQSSKPDSNTVVKAIDKLIESNIIKISEGPYDGNANRGWIVLVPVN